MLNDVGCKTAKAKTKPYKKADSGGLYLLVNPNGAKLWRFKYRFLGKEKLLSIGASPLFSLSEAREARDAAKKLLVEMGGRFNSLYMTMGDYDLMGVYEAPDDAVAARFMLLLGQMGTVRTRTMKAFPEAAFREIVNSLG